VIVNAAADSLREYRDRYPYDGAGLRSAPASFGDEEAARLGVSSAEAAALVADVVEDRLHANELSLIASLGEYAKQDLSAVAVEHVLIESPNAITVYDPGDDSYAIGLDPAIWHLSALLYLEAGIAQRVDDPKLFLVMASKTVGWFFTGAGQQSWTQDVDDLIEFANRATPDLWSLASHVVRTYMNFTVAHEVGHIVLGHLEGANVGKVSLTDGRQCRASALKLQDEEYEADDWAAEALFAVAGTDFTEQTLALTAPALSFSLTALESVLHQPATNEIATAIADSHPPAHERAGRQHERARRHAGEVPGSNAMKHFVELGVWVAEQRRFVEREGMHWVPQWFEEGRF
jgi:hypothetical protein